VPWWVYANDKTAGVGGIHQSIKRLDALYG